MYSLLLSFILIVSATVRISHAAPAPFHPYTRPTQTSYIPELAIRDEELTTVYWPYSLPGSGDDSNPDNLPPPSEVLKSMAMLKDADFHEPTPTPTPISPSHVTILSVLHMGTILDPTETPYWGPGLVVVPTSASMPESEPSQEGTIAPERPNPVPVHKLIVIGSVVGGTIAITLCLFFLVDRRFLALFSRKRRARPTPIPVHSKDGFGRLNSEKDNSVSPWLRFAPPSTSRTAAPIVNEKSTGVGTRPQRVLNITSEEPRSKFSVTSSDYPFTLGSSTPSSSLSSIDIVDSHAGGDEVEEEGGDIVPSPLIPAEESFCVSTSNTQDRRHSRTHSAPSIGDPPPLNTTVEVGRWVRDHRRSKSAAGFLNLTRGHDDGRSC